MEASTGLSQAGRDALGYVGGAVLALSLTPQIIKLLMTRSAADISLIWSLLYLIGNILTFIYLLSIGALAAWIPVVAELLGCTITITLKLLYDYTAWGRTQQQKRQHQQFMQWQQQYLEAMKLGSGDSTQEALTAAYGGDSNAQSADKILVAVKAHYKPKQQPATTAFEFGHHVPFKSSLLYQALSNSGSTGGPGDPAALSAAAAAYSFASFTMLQNSRRGPWYSQAGISHSIAVPAQASIQCCHICGAPQLPRRISSSQAGANSRFSLPGVGLLGSLYQSFTTGVRRTVAGGQHPAGGGNAATCKSSEQLSLGGQTGVAAGQRCSWVTRSAPGLSVECNAAVCISQGNSAAQLSAAGATHTANNCNLSGQRELALDSSELQISLAENAVQGGLESQLAGQVYQQAVGVLQKGMLPATDGQLTCVSNNGGLAGGTIGDDCSACQAGSISTSGSSRFLVWSNAVFSHSNRRRQTQQTTDDVLVKFSTAELAAGCGEISPVADCSGRVTPAVAEATPETAAPGAY